MTDLNIFEAQESQVRSCCRCRGRAWSGGGGRLKNSLIHRDRKIESPAMIAAKFAWDEVLTRMS